MRAPNASGRSTAPPNAPREIRELSLPAPAKLNLFLHVLGRREDGYHELQTVFQFLDYGDELTLTLRNDGEVVRTSGPDGVAPEADLSVRAALALKEASGCERGASIAVTKRLPMGGGVGGGSSDAATVLHGLNALWGLGLDNEALGALGLRLGADVPVFVHGQAAFAEGVGEKLVRVNPPCPWYVLVHPGFGVNTGAVFSHDALTRCTPPLTIPALFSAGATAELAPEQPGHAPVDELTDELIEELRRLHASTANDCEAVVRAMHPEVAEVMEWLSRRHGAVTPARMSGTGSCVFAPFESESAAREALAGAELGWGTGWWGVVARASNESPLMPALRGSPVRPAQPGH